MLEKDKDVEAAMWCSLQLLAAKFTNIALSVHSAPWSNWTNYAIEVMKHWLQVIEAVKVL